MLTDKKQDMRRKTSEVKRLEVDMEQLFGEFKNINSASNVKSDIIKEQYSQDDTGIVDTGATSGVAAHKDCGSNGSHGRKIKKYFYITQRTCSKCH